jgi:hypothetical protein
MVGGPHYLPRAGLRVRSHCRGHALATLCGRIAAHVRWACRSRQGPEEAFVHVPPCVDRYRTCGGRIFFCGGLFEKR